MSDKELENGQQEEPQSHAGENVSPAEESAVKLTAEFQVKISELEKQTVQLKDQLLRKAAEFDNYKRRTENDFANFSRFAAENTLTSLLPVLDDFQRSLKSGKAKSADDPFYKGVEMIYQKFMKVLETQGLKTMEVAGKEFSVDFHDALMQMPRADVPPHTVIEEVEKGYLLFDKVIRHAKVVVSAAPPEETPQTGNETENQ